MLETPHPSRHYFLGNNVPVWDNQQVTRSWVTAILEGEGSFRNTPRSNKEVRISNTDSDIVGASGAFLRANNIWFTTGRSHRVGKKTEYTISVRNSREQVFQYADLFYGLIVPSLECRLAEYQHILGTPET